MSKNWDELKKYQVLGANLQNILGGFGSFTLIASKLLLEEGIGTPDESMMVNFEPDRWYPLDRFLRVFDRIHAEFGNFTLRQVGMHVPQNAQFPSHIVDIMDVFEIMDVGYYLNHGLNDEAMFDPATGEMKDGLGHYRATATGDKRISVQASTPYPCPFDEGIVTALSQRFEPSATVLHDKASCRSRGDDSCTYHVSWK
jgi:hypothetical protein